MLANIRRFLAEGLWNFPLNEEVGARRFFFKWLRISYLACERFYSDKCALGASSLTYYTLMSLVPMLAMALAVARGFGYSDLMRGQILERFQDQNEALKKLFDYADLFLEQAKGGVVAGFGVLILFLTVALLLSNLEAILNQIWDVKKIRSWRRIFSDYLAIMLVAPIFFILASSASVFVVDFLEALIRKLPISQLGVSWLLFLINLIPYGLFWILFSFIYLFMPNRIVHIRSALLGGVIAACLYLFVQWGYIYFQVGVSKYGAVYGSMAALPLLLIWIQLSWFILLFGAEISYAHQTAGEHEFETKAEKASHSFKRLLSLWIVHLSLKGFLTLDLLVHRYRLPHFLAKTIVKELVDCHILHEARGGYVPSHEAQDLRIYDLIEKLDAKGESDFPFMESRAIEPFEKALSSFKELIESSPQNTSLSHVPHTF